MLSGYISPKYERQEVDLSMVHIQVCASITLTDSSQIDSAPNPAHCLPILFLGHLSPFQPPVHFVFVSIFFFFFYQELIVLHTGLLSPFLDILFIGMGYS